MTRQKIFLKDTKSMYLIESIMRLVKKQISQETLLEIWMLIGFCIDWNNDERNNHPILKRN